MKKNYYLDYPEPNDIITSKEIELPLFSDSARFYFNTPANGKKKPRSVEVFVAIDNEVDGPIKSEYYFPSCNFLSRLTGLNRAEVIVIDKSRIRFSSNEAISNENKDFDLAIETTAGQQVTVHFTASFEGYFKINNPVCYLKHYLEGSFEAKEIIIDTLNSFLSSSYQEFPQNMPDGLQLFNKLPFCSELIRDTLSYKLTSELNWVTLKPFRVNVNIENKEEVLEAINKLPAALLKLKEQAAEQELEMKREIAKSKLRMQEMQMQAACNYIERLGGFDHLFPIVEAYINNNPGMSYDDVIKFVERIRDAVANYTPQEIFDAIRLNNWLPN